MPALSFHFACCSHWFYKTEIVLFAEKPARVVYKPHYERNLCVSHRITNKTRNEISYKRLVVANQLLSGAWLFRTRAFHEAWNKKKILHGIHVLGLVLCESLLGTKMSLFIYGAQFLSILQQKLNCFWEACILWF